MQEWEYQAEGGANHRMAAVVMKYMHQVMMHDKKHFYSGIVLGGMFNVPTSTLNKLLSGRKHGWSTIGKIP